jgi:hypothetical protein
VLAIFALISCGEENGQGHSAAIKAMIDSAIRSGASVEDVRTFLKNSADGVDEDLRPVGSSTFLLERGANSQASFLGARWDEDGGGIVTTTTQAYFLFENGRLTEYHLREDYTGP